MTAPWPTTQPDPPGYEDAGHGIGLNPELDQPTQREKAPSVLRRRVPAWSVLATGLFMLGIGLIVGNAIGDPLTAIAGPSAKDQLAAARDTCKDRYRYGGDLAADGSLYFDMKGNDAGSGTGTIDGLACVLNELGTPEYLINEMDSTRALDGRQTGDWGEFTASWRYHPDDGLDVNIRANS